METGKWIILTGDESTKVTTQRGLLQNFASSNNLILSPKSQQIDPLLLKALPEIEQIPESGVVVMAKIISEEIPLINGNNHVLTNGLFLSIIANRVFGDEREDLLPFYQKVMTHIFEKQTPDLVIFLKKLPSKKSLQEQKKFLASANAATKRKLAFQKRIPEGFLQVLKNCPKSLIINTEQDKLDIQKEIKKAARECINGVTPVRNVA